MVSEHDDAGRDRQLNGTSGHGLKFARFHPRIGPCEIHPLGQKAELAVTTSYALIPNDDFGMLLVVLLGPRSDDPLCKGRSGTLNGYFLGIGGLAQTTRQTHQENKRKGLPEVHDRSHLTHRCPARQVAYQKSNADLAFR